MLIYFAVVFMLGVCTGIYLGNKKFRRRFNRALRYISHKEEDEDLYEDEDD